MSVKMEKIPSNMVLQKYVYGPGTIFYTISVPLLKDTMGKWLGVIRRGTYQAAVGDIRWAYELVSYLWPDVEPDSDSSDDNSGDDGSKYRPNPDHHKQEEMVTVTRRKPMISREVYIKVLIQMKF